MDLTGNSKPETNDEMVVHLSHDSRNSPLAEGGNQLRVNH